MTVSRPVSHIITGLLVAVLYTLVTGAEAARPTFFQGSDLWHGYLVLECLPGLATDR